MSPRATFSLALIAVFLAAPVSARTTLVGKWAVGGKCERPLSIVVIDPMGLSGEDFDCRFRTVDRRGNTVRWSGLCNFSENGDEPTRVVAKLDGPHLRYRFVGRGWNGPFTRCPAG